MSRVLVTGGTGFIGSALVKALQAQNHEVACVVRPTSNVNSLKELDVELRTATLDDPESLAEAVKNAEQVYHLAGAISAKKKEDFFKVNEQGTANLADACATLPSPPTLVFVSSLAAAGPSISKDQPRTEAEAPNPVSWYGKSKWAAEQQLIDRADRLPISVVRPPIVFGPGDANVLKMFQSVKSGWHFTPGWLNHRFSLVDVQTLIATILAASEKGSRLLPDDAGQIQGVYFASLDDERPTYTNLGDMIATALACKPPWKLRWGKPVCMVIAYFIETFAKMRGKSTLLSVDKVREATAGSWICSAQRAASELGIRPQKTLAERLRETADWYKEAGWL
jgi:nucleoside-diphosphate-sugar epimerase